MDTALKIEDRRWLVNTKQTCQNPLMFIHVWCKWYQKKMSCETRRNNKPWQNKNKLGGNKDYWLSVFMCSKPDRFALPPFMNTVYSHWNDRCARRIWTKIGPWTEWTTYCWTMDSIERIFPSINNPVCQSFVWVKHGVRVKSKMFCFFFVRLPSNSQHLLKDS